MIKIEVKYDGEWPNLCSGHLILTVDGKVFDFGEFCLSSGGCVYSDGDDYKISTGKWTVNVWPDDFPEDIKDYAVFRINQEIPHGCCGGCI